jgi:hypothetical protein
MDPSVVAAIISVSGSAAIAGAGALIQWTRRRRKKRTFRQVLDDLRQHPVLFLEDDGALFISCQDSAKAGLLNAIRVRVICEPIRAELLALLELLRDSTVANTRQDLETAISAVRGQLSAAQREAMHSFPVQTHGVVQKLIESHGDALVMTADVFASRYDTEQILELVFSVFYVSTFTLLSQWSQAANQLNGHLNGLCWEGRRLEYVFQGNITDALRILNSSVSVLRDALRAFASFVCIVDATGTIRATTSGSVESLGYETQGLNGLSFSALQLGLDGLDGRADIRSLLALDTESVHAALPLRSQTGAVSQAQMCANRVRFTLPEPTYYTVALIVIPPSDLARETCCLEEDAHTRMAFCLTTLTHPSRRVIAVCRCALNVPAEVCAVQDGAPDLPAFRVGKSLHSQMEVPERRIADMYARCALRLQKDLLCSATMTYTWRNKSVTTEFFLVGCEQRQALASVHRLTPEEELPERPTSRAPRLSAAAPRASVVPARLTQGRKMLSSCFRASAPSPGEAGRTDVISVHQPAPPPRSPLS